METAYDWLTLAIFAGLIVLFLERSNKDEPTDHLWQYLVPAVGCALANYAGNHGQGIIGFVIIVGVLAYIHVVLKPSDLWQKR
ncbi:MULTISPECIES: XrtV sorting system accessory protein [unclassified Sphingomonas]|uniref:XrtV sorting system accessory protein n=1 Tax=unclassified Sphingomonas TaxID=196159 RepID=UPI002590A81B|nr:MULTISPECIES: XrtV sorting system accessory protein [unclassified Sphingomonas]